MIDVLRRQDKTRLDTGRTERGTTGGEGNRALCLCLYVTSGPKTRIGHVHYGCAFEKIAMPGMDGSRNTNSTMQTDRILGTTHITHHTYIVLRMDHSRSAVLCHEDEHGSSMDGSIPSAVA